MRILVGHMNARVRQRAIRELENRYEVQEAAIPAALRKGARDKRPDVVVCPPGWLGDEDRREFRRLGTRMVETDVDSLEPEALLALVNAAAAREVSRKVPAPAAANRLANLINPPRPPTPQFGQTLSGRPPTASPMTKSSTGPITFTPPPEGGTDPSRSRLTTPGVSKSQKLNQDDDLDEDSEASKKAKAAIERRTAAREKKQKEAAKKKKHEEGMKAKKLVLIVGLAVLLVGIVIWQISSF